MRLHKIFSNELRLADLLTLAAFTVTGYVLWSLNSAAGLLALGAVISFFLTHRVFRARIVNSYTFLTVISLIVLYALIQMSAWLSSYTHPNADATMILFFTVLLLALLFFAAAFSKNSLEPSSKQRQLINVHDVLALVITGFVVYLIAIPVRDLRHEGLSHEESLLSLITYGVDDASHLGIFHDRIQMLTGVSTDPLRRPDMIDYPATWHDANATVLLALLPNVSIGSQTVFNYIITKLFWFAIAVFVLTRSSLAFMRSSLLGAYGKSHAALAIGAFVTILCTFYIFFDSFTHGFYNFIPLLILTPLFILSIYQLLTEDNGSLSGSIAPVLIFIAASLAWPLVAPAFGASLLLVLVNAGKLRGLKHVGQKSGELMPLLTVVAALAFLAVVIKFGRASDLNNTFFTSFLLIDGGITRWSAVGLVILVGFLATFVGLFLLNRLNKEAVLASALFIFPYFVLVFTIYLIQQVSTQNNQYYYFKAFVPGMVGTLLVATVVMGDFAARLEEKLGAWKALVVLVPLLTIVSQLMVTSPSIFRYIGGESSVKPDDVKVIWREMEMNGSNSYLNGGVSVFFSDSFARNELSSWLLKTNKPDSGCYRYLLVKSFSGKPDSIEADRLIAECDQVSVTVYTTPELYMSLNAQLSVLPTSQVLPVLGN